MKKVLLGVAVFAIFVIYSIHQRSDGSKAAVVLSKKPTTTAQTNNSTPSTSSPPPTSTSVPASSTTTSKYKDGTYTGSVADAFYGNVQIEVVIQSGRITAVNFLQYPNDRQTSREINSQAMPLLQQEAIAAQSAQVDGVSGATDTSMAFVQSLTAALSHAG